MIYIVNTDIGTIPFSTGCVAFYAERDVKSDGIALESTQRYESSKGVYYDHCT